MIVPIRRRRQAQDELLAYVDRIADDDPDVAIRFIEAFERLCTTLARHPESGRTYEPADPALKRRRIRRAPIPGFPRYLVFYTFDGETVEILHVLHARLDHRRRLRPS
ncbi:type II toxin-antitoxin system RelE/ParE family toxin [Candidatus Binatia bacterium]|nr:type II toxin-antitoxin system RelE/ParE family toxin [Candidatus Binatia bacterium]